jgi:AcrR family transcriptional regulator
MAVASIEPSVGRPASIGPSADRPSADRPSAGEGRALRWEEHKQRTRRELAASARRLFAERGFEATSAADIAAGAGVTERTLFRYFPTKIALVLDEALALMPEMFQAILERPAAEPPYQAVCEGVIEFALRHRDLLLLLAARPPATPALPLAGQQRTLIDFEDTLADVLRERYAVSADDQVTAAVWARACIAALRTALVLTVSAPLTDGTHGTPVVDTIRACFAALTATPS